MSDAWNVSVSDDQLEQLNLRAKHRISELQVVLTGTYQRKSVSEIARQLGCSRNKIIWMQQVLRLRTAQGTRVATGIYQSKSKSQSGRPWPLEPEAA